MNQAVLKMCDDWGVPPENVRAAPLVGSRVEGRFGGGDEWFPGTISDVSSR